MRPAQLHFAVSSPGFEPLVTQMYYFGDPHLECDRIFNGIADPAARASVVVTLAPAVAELSPAAEVVVFDIVLTRLVGTAARGCGVAAPPQPIHWWVGVGRAPTFW